MSEASAGPGSGTPPHTEMGGARPYFNPECITVAT
jgi:hypothetical protein